MRNLSTLRKLAQHKEYTTLRELALSSWQSQQQPALLPLLALAYAHLKQISQAHATVQQAASHYCELDVDARVDMAAVFIALFHIDAAQNILHAVLQRKPHHSLALARLGYCHRLCGELDMAQNLFEQAASSEPESLPILSNLVQVEILQGQYDQAQTTLNQGLGQLQTQQGSEAALTEQTYQQHWQSLTDLQLQLWVASEQFSQAETWLQQQQATLEEQTFVDWLIRYARLQTERNGHAEAEAVLKLAMKEYPHNTSLCVQLSELALLQGHVLPAITLLRKALQKDKDNISLWVQLSNACLHRFDQQARKAAEKAVELAESLKEDEQNSAAQINLSQAQAQNVLALIESQEQQFDAAEQRYQRILAKHEFFVPALQGLGQQHMQRGNIDAALALFEQVKRLDPIKGHSALINARHFPENVETLQNMAKAAEMPSLEGPVRSGILFQLAAAWEKRKDYTQAFQFAEQANNASKQFLHYDAPAHRNYCARLRMSFCQALYQHRGDCGVESTLPVFVLGMPRSGTTLVEQILAGHDDIFAAGELGVIPQVIQGLNRWERHVGSGRHYPDCIDDLTVEITAGIANNVLKELQTYAPEAKHIIDKMPHNFENIGLIKFLFPKAKIISVRRDPRDIALSNYFTDYQAKHGGMGFAYELEDIGQQLADHNLLMHHWQQLFPDILEVHYEAVVEDLEGTARKMLDYIGVAWQQQVLAFNELDRPVKTASVWQVRQPIYNSSKAKWRHYEAYLPSLLAGTNAKICADDIDMFTLPEPGFLTAGVALYREGDLDGAELSFKKMLHHNPEHAACNYMVGLVYLSKGYLEDGIKLLEKALAKVPWHKEWRENLGKAYGLAGEPELAAKLQRPAQQHDETDWQDPLHNITAGSYPGMGAH
ncbi:MAG: sulfotransferase [Pseudomonadales bacterium]|nr:sulfotransferase [Pseudomonadales bacterium]